jgi:hypothetical protein
MRDGNELQGKKDEGGKISRLSCATAKSQKVQLIGQEHAGTIAHDWWSARIDCATDKHRYRRHPVIALRHTRVPASIPPELDRPLYGFPPLLLLYSSMKTPSPIQLV